MGPATQLAVGLTNKLARQAVATFVALALVGVTVGGCQCPTRAIATAQCACCCSGSGPSTPTTVRANTCINGCGTADGETTLAESLAKLSTTPPAGAVSNAAARHDDSVRLPVGPLVEVPFLVRSSRHPVLRI
jgi:hypothetical protein